ncbi:response regulator [Paramagnetospirillum caucaseum]|uniref:Response regulator n=1 Tax=Paramagnetospirillum caucaseum TaxID=1244869 RepID=M2Z8I1_9PROT|nr:response regulator [Paramagnetospirillum caucaseum]EME70605.1 response regulator [Paramagnetospirillum caucaseum]
MGRRVCVLIIEPNAHMRRLIGILMGAVPAHEVIEARTPQQAAALVAERAPHLVIMDWSDDPTEGVLFVHRLRRGEIGRADVPILAISPTLHHAVLESAGESGIDEIIAKPISAVEIIARATDLIELDRRRTESAEQAAE